ncbi:MAG: hypothetical protein IT428_05270 [Planctomycetaceae bacterium]|nr:hypothetical protein [Planctomycetaceae bacterium]
MDNITCAEFAVLPEAQQRVFVLGVANGRGLTVGLFDAYAGAAEDLAESPTEKEAVATSHRTIRGLMTPLLNIDADSLLNGIRSACRRPEMQGRLVIDAIFTLHLDAAKALKGH